MTDMPQQKQFYRVTRAGFSFAQVFRQNDYVLLYPEQAQYFLPPYAQQLEPVEMIADGGVAADLAAYRETWLGAASDDPPATKDGEPLPEGARYWNTSNQVVRVLTASGWRDETADLIAATQAAQASAQSAATNAGYAESARRDAQTSRDVVTNATASAANSATAAGNSATAAAASQTAAANSATAAGNSASAAAASQTAAAGSATAAGNSATAAAASQTAAAGSATAAGNSATAAAASQTAAAGSATAAGNSATAAAASQTAAAGSATAAGNSATAAAASQTAAANSATAAGSSATAASNSATAAANSAAQAAASATAAAASAGHIRGAYATLAALQTAVPTGNAGDFAILTKGAGTSATVAVWDSDNSPAAWVDTGVAAPTSIDWTAITNKPAAMTDIAALARTKGALIAGGASAWALLAPGSDGQILVADSTQATGLRYTTIAASLGYTPVAPSRQVIAGGIVTGGGALSADVTLTVTKSSQAQAQAGTDDTTAMTPLRVADAITALGKKLTQGTAVATTSGTAVDFTGIPNNAKRITIEFSGVSTNGASPPQLQIGSGAIVATGYLGANSIIGAASVVSANWTTGFGIGVNTSNWSAAQTVHGTIVLTNVTGNTWVASGVLADSNGANTRTVAGSITLAGALDRLRLTTANGTDTFDAGNVNIIWE